MVFSLHFHHQIGRADPGLDKELLMRGVNDTTVQAYLKFMIDVAVMFGANRTRAQDEMTDVLLFEEILVKVCQQNSTKNAPISTTCKSYILNSMQLVFCRFHLSNSMRN